MSEYSQGVCEDGAAILKNGQMMTIEEILADLRERDQLEEQIGATSIISESYKHERDRYKDELKEVKAELPSVENGKNRYGLDASYFRNLINRELNRPLANYKPDEFARVCLRMAMTADRSVVNEREFTSRMNLAEHDAEVIEQFSADLSTITNEMKVECIGEFSWEEEADYYDEDGEYVEYVATRVVPWDLCKKIYKQMLSMKLRQKAQEPEE